ncbi:hypothetical protein [Amycolatopsis anabasis]|uniref:hypothetical protein n=1 Tax=Amycolatopsis anabasis TaxID=1840409 RepID=UPI00131AD994|nr:hypothetical protein [Amycolatopsis anabasis]
MSSGQVPLWVPIVVAVFGFTGVIAAQLIAGWREDRRWRRELEREEVRWARERERERDNRSYEGRAAGYAELIGAIESFDWVLYQARRLTRRGDELDGQLAAELRKVTAEARGVLGPVNVHAPERIRAMVRESMIRRSDLSVLLLSGRKTDEQDRLWREAQLEYRVMRAAMRRDLGLDTEDLPSVAEANQPPV